MDYCPGCHTSVAKHDPNRRVREGLVFHAQCVVLWVRRMSATTRVTH